MRENGVRHGSIEHDRDEAALYNINGVAVIFGGPELKSAALFFAIAGNDATIQ
jgi:hypothetical protein